VYRKYFQLKNSVKAHVQHVLELTSSAKTYWHMGWRSTSHRWWSYQNQKESLLVKSIVTQLKNVD